jgi:UDP-N-acetylmuramate-alanine ligase
MMMILQSAISSFTGAAKRLELFSSKSGTNVYKDFAHSPSKVKSDDPGRERHNLLKGNWWLV